jgi:hypothetical protein
VIRTLDPRLEVNLPRYEQNTLKMHFYVPTYVGTCIQCQIYHF